jgi:hypothetical protein
VYIKDTKHFSTLWQVVTGPNGFGMGIETCFAVGCGGPVIRGTVALSIAEVIEQFRQDTSPLDLSFAVRIKTKYRAHSHPKERGAK